jgi:hypothetical protein
MLAVPEMVSESPLVVEHELVLLILLVKTSFAMSHYSFARRLCLIESRSRTLLP